MRLGLRCTVLALLLVTALALPLAEATPPVRARQKSKIVTKTFSTVAPISIPPVGTSGAASPYPAVVTSSELRKGKIRDVNVFLNNFTHTLPADVDILLVSTRVPSRNAVIMSDVGGNMPVTDVSLILDDEALEALPQNGPLVSGTFQPADDGGADTFPTPAPAPFGGSSLSIFDGQPANGAWQLFIVDDSDLSVGFLEGGWALQITAKIKKHKHRHRRH